MAPLESTRRSGRGDVLPGRRRVVVLRLVIKGFATRVGRAQEGAFRGGMVEIESVVAEHRYCLLIP